MTSLDMVFTIVGSAARRARKALCSSDGFTWSGKVLRTANSSGVDGAENTNRESSTGRKFT